MINVINEVQSKMDDAEARLRLATEGTGLATWDLDLKTSEIVHSSRLSEIFGFDSSTILSHKKMREHIHPDDVHSIVEKAFDEALKTSDYYYEARVIRPDKSVGWIRTRGKVLYNELHEPSRMLGTLMDVTAEKATSIALHESEYRHRQLIQGLPAAFYTCNAEGYIETYNDAAVKLWGRTPEIGKDVWCGSWKIYHPDGSPLLLSDCPMALTLKTGNAIEGQEIVIERPDGTKVNVLPYPRPIISNEGKITGATNMLVDITEMKHAVNALQESEQRFKIIADTAPVMIWMAGRDGLSTFFNKEWLQFRGRSMEEETGGGWREGIHPDDIQRCVKKYDESFDERKEFELEYRLRNSKGEYRWILSHGVPRYTEDGAFLGYIGGCTDIHEIKTAREEQENLVSQRTNELNKKNEELLESEERYHKMIEEVEDYAIILLDRDGNIQNWNKGAEKIKGYKAEDIIGKSFSVFYRKEDQRNKLPQTLIAQAVEKGKAVHEGWRVRKDGTTFWGSIVITALHDKKNNIIGFSKVTRDLTERKITEDALKAKNDELELINKELSSFTYIASHDLQEPLRKIQTFSNRILETEINTLSDSGKDYFDRLSGAAQRMQKLIEDLLSYSRTNTLEKVFERFDLNVLLEEVKGEMKEILEEKNVKIQSDALPTTDIIPFQFKQLLTNLFSNSIKFSKNDSVHIDIHYQVIFGNNIEEGLLPYIRYHHISVTDNGIGFEPQYSKHIFEIFQRLHGRTTYPGTGIGLAICKKIAENHNGKIIAESEMGKGATFNIYLPV